MIGAAQARARASPPVRLPRSLLVSAPALMQSRPQYSRCRAPARFGALCRCRPRRLDLREPRLRGTELIAHVLHRAEELVAVFVEPPIELTDRNLFGAIIDAQIEIFVFQPTHRISFFRLALQGRCGGFNRVVALWRAVTRYSVLRRVVTRIIAERRDGFDLAQLFGVARDRFAADEKLVAAWAFDGQRYT